LELAEVAALDGEVGGHSDFFAWLEAEEGAIVANSKAQAGSGRAGNAPTDLVDEGQFAQLPGGRRSGFALHLIENRPGGRQTRIKGIT